MGHAHPAPATGNIYISIISIYCVYKYIYKSNKFIYKSTRSIYTAISPYPQAGPLLSPGWCLQSLLLQSQANLLAHTLMQGHGE